jgi:hypothetical protein
VTDAKPAKALEDALAEPKLQIALHRPLERAERHSAMSANIAPTVAGQVSLNDLTVGIHDAHVGVVSAFNSAIDNAIVAGELLIKAKELTPHGHWGKFLKRCDVGERQSERYMKLAELVQANPTSKSDLTNLSIEQAIKRLLPPKTHDRPQPAALKQPAKHSEPTKSSAAKTGHTDIIEAWLDASVEQRTLALDSIGLKPLLAAIPPAWWPLIEQHLAERQKPPIPTVTATSAIPDDLSIPPFLQRAPAAALLKVGTSI